MPSLAGIVVQSTVQGTPALGSKFGLTAAATALTVMKGDGVKFPPVPFNAIIGPPYGTVFEVVKVTAITGDVLTITRAQAGGIATAQGWDVGTDVTVQITSDPSLQTATPAVGGVVVAVPATTVATAAQTYHAVVYWLTAGTVTVVSVGGTTLPNPVVGASFIVPAGVTVTLTYSGAPTWQWFVIR